MKRRSFLAGMAAGAAISTLDWLRFFKSHGVPGSPKELGMAKAAAQAMADPHFLIYWFQEGGWEGYSLLNPIDTRNDAQLTIPAGSLTPNPSWSAQRYRPTGYALAGNPPSTSGNIVYGNLAAGGSSLFPDLAVVASHHGATFHSGSRWEYHYGKYSHNLSDMRQPDERTVMQAFCEAYGQSYLLPHISWHRWLSDGELALDSYPNGTGYYENLGPAWAWTIYGQTPADMRNRLTQIKNLNAGQRDARIRTFVDNLHDSFLKDKSGPTVAAFQSAVDIHRALVMGNSTAIDPATLFTDTQLRTDFNLQNGDESTNSRSVNGNPARSKYSPATNVQALMTYELMTKGLSCGFWLENRDIRAFDSHGLRQTIMNNQGQTDQTNLINTNLWAPLKTLVAKLKGTPYPGMTGKSYWDFTTIVLCSEMGRSIYGDVASILGSNDSDASKYSQIMQQDVCAHWPTSSVAFLGGSVKGNASWGRVGTSSQDAIPLMPDGTLDPAYDPVTGQLKQQQGSVGSFVPDAGSVYATALYLSGIDPTGKGRNTGKPMKFIHK
jgi:hypothetical protein